MNEKKVWLITGITGQDSSYLSEILLKDNQEVHGIMRRSSTLTTERIDHVFDPSDRDHVHYGDLTEETLSKIKILVDKSQFAWVRDHRTYLQLGWKGIKTIYAPCPTLISYKVFGIDNSMTNTQPTVGIAFGKHGDFIISEWQKVLEFYREIVTKLLERTEVKIYQIQHRPIDIAAFEDLSQLLESKYRNRIKLVNPESGQGLIRMFARCCSVISLYLHPGLMAYGAGVPLHMIGYDVKCSGFYEDVIMNDGYSTYQSLVDDLETETIINKIIETIKTGEMKAKHRIRKRIEDKLKLIEFYFKLISKQILYPLINIKNLELGE